MTLENVRKIINSHNYQRITRFNQKVELLAEREQVWQAWGQIVPLLSTAATEADTARLAAAFHRFKINYRAAFGVHNCTPYIHVLLCHVIPMIKRVGCLSRFSQQGLEHVHLLQKTDVERSTNNGGGKSKSKSNNLYAQMFLKGYRQRLLKLAIAQQQISSMRLPSFVNFCELIGTLFLLLLWWLTPFSPLTNISVSIFR